MKVDSVSAKAKWSQLRETILRWESEARGNAMGVFTSPSICSASGARYQVWVYVVANEVQLGENVL